jgi:hypothetical protein
MKYRGKVDDNKQIAQALLLENPDLVQGDSNFLDTVRGRTNIFRNPDYYTINPTKGLANKSYNAVDAQKAKKLAKLQKDAQALGYNLS